MSRADTLPLWRNPALRRAAGDTLRPGGFELTDRACELAGLRPGQPVLDVGCGQGATVLRLRSRFGARAVGLDLEPRPDPAARPPLVRGDAQRLPFAPGSFRLVLCECVLSLLPDPDAALAEFRRVLVPDGILALSDLYRTQATGADRNLDSCAVGALTRKDLARRVARAGLTVTCFEDHSAHLRDLAVRLAWQGVAPACGTGAAQTGYGLLLAVADQPRTKERG